VQGIQKEEALKVKMLLAVSNVATLITNRPHITDLTTNKRFTTAKSFTNKPYTVANLTINKQCTSIFSCISFLEKDNQGV
jgi:hypothetical protein